MPAEHRRPGGGWGQGYYCMTCGDSGLNMYGMGHGPGICTPNPELVRQLIEVNEKEENGRQMQIHDVGGNSRIR